MRTLRTADVQILNELRGLTRSWTGERRPEGMCDVLFDRLLDVPPRPVLEPCWLQPARPEGASMVYPGVGLIVVGLLAALLLPALAAGPLVHVIAVLGWIVVAAGVGVLLWHLFAAHRHVERR